MKEEKYAKKIKSKEKSNETKKSNPAKETKKSSSKKVTENKSVERTTQPSEQVVKPDTQKQQSSKSPTYNAATMLQNANKEMLAKKRRRNTAIGVTAGILLATAIIVPAVYLNGKIDINVSVPALQQDESFSVVVKRGFKVGDLQPKEIEGYTFEGFYKDANLTERYSDDDKITKDITIYAKYTANVYAITFPSSPYFTIEGEDIENNKAYAEYDTEYSFRVNLSAGYTESDIHVYLGETELIPVDGVYTITIKGDSTINITGVEINTYSVVYYDEDAETIIHSEEVDYNTASTYTDTPEKPADNTYTYTFSGWVYYDSGEPITDELTHVINNIKVKASYTATYIEYTIGNIPTQVTIQKGSETLTSSDTLHYGDEIDISYTPTTGYDMTSFNVSGATLVSGDTYRVTGNLTVTYTETIQVYTITIESNNTSYGTVDEATLSIPYGTTYQVEGNDLVFSNGARVTPTPASSDAQYTYTFTGWSEISGTITGEETLTAIFTREYVEYSIENPYAQVTIKRDGETLTSESTLHYGDELEITYTPTSGYEMTTFTVTGADRVGETDTYTVTANLVIDYAEEAIEYLDFTIEGGVITGYTGSDTNVVIPSTYSISNGSIVAGTDYTVTQIGESAFEGNAYVTSVTLPDTIEAISDRAFSDCENLKNINIPINVTSLGTYLFDGCNSLETVVYSANACTAFGRTESVVYTNPFQNINPNVDIIISNNVRLIPDYFLYCDTHIGSLGGGNSAIIVNSVVLEENSQLESIGSYAFYGSSLTNITIPSSVTSIGDYAFQVCGNLTTVTFGENSQLTSIGDSAFLGSGLISITIPENVTSIGERAFQNCSNLTDVYFAGDINDWVTISFGYNANPLSNGANLYLNGDTSTPVTGEINIDTATSIGAYSFYGWTGLTKVTIGEQVTSIGNSAFYGCSSLQYNIYEGGLYLGNTENLYMVLMGIESTDITEFTIHSDCKFIYDRAFYNCSSLTNITIPSSVTSIGRYAFSGCSNLTTVTFGENSQLTSIGDYAFYNCSSLTSITIPSSVTSIGDYAFYNCDSLTSVTVPSSVTSIGRSAFYGCSSLTSVTFENTSGWYRTTSSTATSGTRMTVTDPAQNATYLKSTYSNYYWKRNA